MSDYSAYSKKALTFARPYVPGENLDGVSVSKEDEPARVGGFIARNPDNHTDRWYIGPEYFAKHYESAG